MQVIICYGNPIDGFGYIGPFFNSEEARQYIKTDRELRQRDAWVAALDAPDSTGDDNVSKT